MTIKFKGGNYRKGEKCLGEQGWEEVILPGNQGRTHCTGESESGPEQVRKRALWMLGEEHSRQQ